MIQKSTFVQKLLSKREMAELKASLQTYRGSKEKLKSVVSDKHKSEIAKRVGDAWESLATFIGISNVEVDDIKE